MKFSIRDLLLVTVIVALALGWWADSVRKVDHAKKIQSDLYHAESQLALHREAVLHMREGIDELKRRLPNPLPPAPTLPKK